MIGTTVGKGLVKEEDEATFIHQLQRPSKEELPGEGHPRCPGDHIQTCMVEGQASFSIIFASGTLCVHRCEKKSALMSNVVESSMEGDYCRL